MADETGATLGPADDTATLLMADGTTTTAELGAAGALLIAEDGAQLTTNTTGVALAGAVGLAPGIGMSVELLHSYCAGE